MVSNGSHKDYDYHWKPGFQWPVWSYKTWSVNVTWPPLETLGMEYDHHWKPWEWTIGNLGNGIWPPLETLARFSMTRLKLQNLICEHYINLLYTVCVNLQSVHILCRTGDMQDLVNLTYFWAHWKHWLGFQWWKPWLLMTTIGNLGHTVWPRNGIYLELEPWSYSLTIPYGNLVHHSI